MSGLGWFSLGCIGATIAGIVGFYIWAYRMWGDS